MEHPV